MNAFSNLIQQLKTNAPAMIENLKQQYPGQTPQQIIQGLMNSGQISQQQYNQGLNMVRSLGFKL